VRVRAPAPARVEGRRRPESLTGLVGGESVVGAPLTFRFAAPLSSPCQGLPRALIVVRSLSRVRVLPRALIVVRSRSGAISCLVQLAWAPHSNSAFSSGSDGTGTGLSWNGCVNSKAHRSRMLVAKAPPVSARVLRFRVRSSVVHAFVGGQPHLALRHHLHCTEFSAFARGFLFHVLVVFTAGAAQRSAILEN
jgi:hypothetical protein